MSRAFIAFYMGDYDKDTQALSTLEHGAYFLLLKQCWVHGSIPLEPARRASIAKLSLREWSKIAPVIDPFFDDEGRNRRATREIEKADTARLKRAMAGHRGGLASGRSKAIRRGTQSNAEAGLKHSYSGASSIAEAEGQANGQAKSKQYEANKNSNITTTSPGTAREGSPGVEDAPPRTNSSTAATDELAAIMQKKRWVRPC